MKIYACIFGIAGAATVSILYTSLGLLLKYLPGQSLKLIGTIHMMPKLDYIRPFIKVTPEAIATGLLTHAILSFIFFWIIATIYNLLQKIFQK